MKKRMKPAKFAETHALSYFSEIKKDWDIPVRTGRLFLKNCSFQKSDGLQRDNMPLSSLKSVPRSKRWRLRQRAP